MPVIFRDGPPTVLPEVIYKLRKPRKSGEHSASRFVASRFGQKFHKPECKWMQDVRQDNLIVFDSHEDAAKLFKPCGTCRA
jgi:hypothetical protein